MLVKEVFFEVFQEEAEDRSGEKLNKRGREDGRKFGRRDGGRKSWKLRRNRGRPRGLCIVTAPAWAPGQLRWRQHTEAGIIPSLYRYRRAAGTQVAKAELKTSPGGLHPALLATLIKNAGVLMTWPREGCFGKQQDLQLSPHFPSASGIVNLSP